MVVGSNRTGIQRLSLEKGVLILKLSINSDKGKNSELNDLFFNDSLMDNRIFWVKIWLFDLPEVPTISLITRLVLRANLIIVISTFYSIDL